MTATRTEIDWIDSRARDVARRVMSLDDEPAAQLVMEIIHDVYWAGYHDHVQDAGKGVLTNGLAAAFHRAYP